MQQYIGFTLFDTEYTIPILMVQEIINMPSITKMPQSPTYVEGITNLRGTVIPIINIKKLGHLNGISISDDSLSNEGMSNKVIVISNGGITFGMLVDKITGVITIDESFIEPPEGFLFNNASHIEGVAKLKDRLVVLLDTRRLIPNEDLALFENIEAETKNSEDKKNETIDTIDKGIQERFKDFNANEIYNAKDFLEKSRIESDDPRYMIFDDILIFLEAISNKDDEKMEMAYRNIMKKGQNELFNEVGKITRKLHDSIRSFKDAIDPKLKEMATVEMPSAIDKLNFVIEKTEEAANKTMSIVEKYVLSMDEVSSHIRNIKEPQESVEFLKRFKNNLEDDLTEILTAQSFQDITGQTIKKVIKLVGDIEEELVKLIATFGLKLEEGKKADIIEEKVSQSDVDELLKEFGF